MAGSSSSTRPIRFGSPARRPSAQTAATDPTGHAEQRPDGISTAQPDTPRPRRPGANGPERATTGANGPERAPPGANGPTNGPAANGPARPVTNAANPATRAVPGRPVMPGRPVPGRAIPGRPVMPGSGATREAPDWDLVRKRNNVEKLKFEKFPLKLIDEIEELGERDYLDISE